MSRPPFISIKTSHVENELSSGWHGNVLTGTADYLYALGHFAGAMAIKFAEIGVETIREVIDRK